MNMNKFRFGTNILVKIINAAININILLLLLALI